MSLHMASGKKLRQKGGHEIRLFRKKKPKLENLMTIDGMHDLHGK